MEMHQECLAVFRGREFADLLNSCYRYRALMDTLVLGDDGTHRRTRRAASSALFLRSGSNEPSGAALREHLFDRRPALACLEGA